MKKAIINIGYTQYVLDVDKAIQLLSLLEGAELYDEVWVKDGVCKGEQSYHIYEQDPKDCIRQLKLIPMSFYNVARMAGRPERK